MHYKDPALTEMGRALTCMHLRLHANAHGGVFLNLGREQDNHNLSNNLFTQFFLTFLLKLTDDTV